MRQATSVEISKVTHNCQMRHSDRGIDYIRDGRLVARAEYHGKAKPRKIRYLIANVGSDTK